MHSPDQRQFRQQAAAAKVRLVSLARAEAVEGVLLFPFGHGGSATVAAAAGIAIPATRELDGVDLLPFVTGRDSGTPHDILHACNSRDGVQWSVRKGDWKLVNDYPDTSHFTAKPRPATVLGLFDLSTDPRERSNVIDKHPEIAAELRKLHDDFMASCPPGLGSTASAATTRKVKPEQAPGKGRLP